ncbi:MAG: hypothetical protein ACXVIX_10350 [Halobacteriota archaeon]
MACFTVVVGQLVHLVVAALVVTVCGQQEHFVVVGQRAHFVVALVELWQHVHCAPTVDAQPEAAVVPHVFAEHGAVDCAVTLAAVKSDRAASTTSIKTTAFFIQFLLSSWDVVASSAFVLLPPYKYIFKKILVPD